MDNASLFFLVYNLNNRSPLLDQLMIFGSVYLIFLMVILVFILAVKGNITDKKAALLLILALPIAILIAKLIPLIYYESRPFVYYHFLPVITKSADASFPSRHATISAVVAACFAYYKSKWAPLFIFCAVWIGIARVFVGVHYPQDIVGGFFVAILATVLAVYIKKLLQARFLR